MSSAAKRSSGNRRHQGIYATLASDPIRRPKDAITEFVTVGFTLETGVFAGLVVFTVGAGLAGGMVLQWIATGYEAIPSVGASLLAFTAIVVGVQAVFGSFFIGIIHDT